VTATVALRANEGQSCDTQSRALFVDTQTGRFTGRMVRNSSYTLFHYLQHNLVRVPLIFTKKIK